MKGERRNQKERRMKGLAFAYIVSLAMALSGCGHCFDLRPHGSYKSCQDDGAK